MGQFEINRHMEKSPNKVGITVIYVKFGMVLHCNIYKWPRKQFPNFSQNKIISPFAVPFLIKMRAIGWVFDNQYKTRTLHRRTCISLKQKLPPTSFSK